MTAPLANTASTAPPAFISGITEIRAWRWPLVLTLLIIVLVISLEQSHWNPWARPDASLQVIQGYSALKQSPTAAFASAPWQWPSVYATAVFGVIQLLHTLAAWYTKSSFLEGTRSFLGWVLPFIPSGVSIMGCALWLLLLRRLLHQWNWPPIARWGALAVLATHPIFLESLFTGGSWQGCYWVFLLSSLPKVITTVPLSHRRPVTANSATTLHNWLRLPSPVWVGCLLGLGLWVLGLFGFLASVALCGICLRLGVLGLHLVKNSPSRSHVAWGSILQGASITLALLFVFSMGMAYTSHSALPFLSNVAFPDLAESLPLNAVHLFNNSVVFGGLWGLVAIVTTLWLPTTPQLHLWGEAPSKSSNARSRKQQPVCWPKPLWWSGIFLGGFLNVPSVAALWLSIGIGQTLLTWDASTTLKGNALRWLDAMGITFILGGLLAAIVLFQWCPDALPWFSEPRFLESTQSANAIMTLSLGAAVWEIAWWKLVVSGWLLSVIVLGFGLLLRGHRLTVQEGVGLTAASVLWCGVVLHEGILPWIQPTPATPIRLTGGLTDFLSHTPASTVIANHSLSLTTQQMGIQTAWQSLIQSETTTSSALPQPLLKPTHTVQLIPEADFYQRLRVQNATATTIGRVAKQTAIDVQRYPVIRWWPHPTRGWLDAESLVWVVAPSKSNP